MRSEAPEISEEQREANRAAERKAEQKLVEEGKVDIRGVVYWWFNPSLDDGPNELGECLCGEILYTRYSSKEKGFVLGEFCPHCGQPVAVELS